MDYYPAIKNEASGAHLVLKEQKKNLHVNFYYNL